MRLSPVSIFTGLGPVLRQLLLPLVILMVGGSGQKLLDAVGPLSGIGIGITIVIAAGLPKYFTTTYEVTSHEVILNTGWIWKRRRVVPRERIQEVQVSQPLVHRALKVAVVKLETAGSGALSEVSLDCLGLEQAHALRDLLLKRDAPSATQAAEKPPVYALSLDRIVKSSLLENRALALAAVGFGFIMENDSLRDQLISRAMEASKRVDAITGVLMALAALSAGWIFSVVLGVWKFYGFRVDLTERGIQIRQGLGNVTTRAVTLSRVQHITVRQGLLYRLAGYHSVAVSTAGDVHTKQQDAFNGYVSPAATRSEVSMLANLIFPGLRWVTSADKRLPKLAMIARSVDTLLAIAFPLAVLIAFNLLVKMIPLVLAVGTVILLLPLLFVRGVRTERYAQEGGYFRRHRGYVTWQGEAAPVARLQGVQVVQSPLQRRLGLANVTLNAPGSAVTVRDVEFDEANQVKDDLLAERRQHRGRGV